MSQPGPKVQVGRLQWLDIARILCALMILGIHWLRAGYKLQLFGGADSTNLVMNYQSNSGGLRLFHYILIAGTKPDLSTWLTNLVGVLGGFGWEAVSALILISGFSLTLVQSEQLKPSEWLTWYGKRAKRILVPYYMIAATFLFLYAFAVTVLRHSAGHFASVIESKLLSQFSSPLPGIITSHLFLFDPWAPQWNADFFAPAWWFVPAILLAYMVYPAVLFASRTWGGVKLLFVSAAITIASYAASNAGMLINESWYYIVLQEAFNFSLGVVLANIWLSRRRPLLEGMFDNPKYLLLAFGFFVIGNVANWSPTFRPIASMLYGPSLTFILAFMGRRLQPHAIGRALRICDPYDLYLVHQPFAFPIALIAKVAFHGYAVFLGWFVFVAVAGTASKLFSVVFGRIFAPRPGSGRARTTHIVAQT